MPAPSTTDDYLALVKKCDLVPAGRLDEYVASKRTANAIPDLPIKLALMFVQDGLLTRYQAEQLLGGRWRNFIVGGKYKLLERIGKGGMALVFLCEHVVMKRLVALKILPSGHAQDKELLGRFHREARALSSLRHPNIVGAYDADRADQVHFLVMEYVDGGDLEQIVQRVGPLGWERAAEYVRQAAHGLQHAHEVGMVHRDIKPGNLLVDRSGTVKLLDLGLARIFHETTDDLTTGRDAQTLLGTVDYLAPEQAVNSHDVDIRADIYSLGATFYYILTGKGLFEDGSVAEKLSWHLHRPPAPITVVRPDVPAGLSRVIERMLAKNPNDRYQTPDEVVEALEPWTRTQIPPPDPNEFPELSRAARTLAQPSSFRLSNPSSRPSNPNITRTPAAVSKVMNAPVVAAPPPPPAKPRPRPEPKLVTSRREAPPVPRPEPASKSSKLRRRLALAGMAAGVLGIVGVAAWSYFEKPPVAFELANNPRSTDGSKRPPGGGSVAEPSPAEPVADIAPAVEREADATISLVNAAGTARTFANLREAIKAAKPGDRIAVAGSLVVDSIEMSDVEGVPRDLTIEGTVPGSKGQPVRWRGPKGLGADRPLLDVGGLEGFRLKGFAFDGQGRSATLVRLSGRGGGSMLEDLQFQGATRSAIVVHGWAGESSRPATIRKSRFTAIDSSEAAILFEADHDRPDLVAGAIRVEGCRFVGPYQADLLLATSVDGLEVEQCRFHQATDGVRYRRGPSREAVRVRLANNTFSDLQRGIHFETTPRAASSELVVVNSIFTNTTRAATLDRVSVEPAKVAARWIWFDEGKKNTVVPPGIRQFRKAFDLATVPDRANLDISCDETFTVWLNGSELMANPLPHYSQRVYSINLAGKLKAGRNVLAVRGSNSLDRLDSKFGTTAGLLAQITALQGGREVVLAKTDETWKCSDQAPDNWFRPEFDDRTWSAAKPWLDDSISWPWKFAVWDSAINAQIKSPLEPIKVTASGNVRDYKSWEGYPTLDAERIVIGEKDLLKNPGDDSTFLRYSPKHPLATAGPGGASLGAFEEDRPAGGP